MSLRRIGVLLERELIRGPKNFLFIFAIIVPVIITLLVNLVFGSLFAGKPRLGIMDQGDSRLVSLVRDDEAIDLQEYGSVEAMKSAVARGALDFGLVLPPGFDADLIQGQVTKVLGFAWGESLLKNRAILSSTIIVLLRQIAGQEPPVEIVIDSVGEAEVLPWEDRLLPFIVMMTVLIGGLMVPATSLVDEKQKRTIMALTATPTTLGEIFAAKGMLGVMLSFGMGMFILLINRALGIQPGLLIILMGLGAVMAASFGVLLGVWVKDIDTLFATIKGLGILLYAPALVYMFPEIPQWIGRLSPTYYMIAPVIEIIQKGATLKDIVLDVSILIVLIMLLIIAINFVGRRMQVQDL